MELKPCPFCGVKPIISQWPVSNTLYVECVNRKCKINPSTALKGWKDINKHIAAWNKRADKDVTLIQQATWIPVTNGRGGHECSACQDYAPSYQNGKERLSLFCPSCGAMMLRRIDND